jgi:hypothetical protein
MRRRKGLSALLAFLSHPLILVGVVGALFFGVLTRLIESGVFPRLAQKDTAPIVDKLLDYGFVVALAVVVLGFALQFYKLYRGRPPIVSSAGKTTALEERNRQAMLERVRSMWVEGVLEQSLYQVARMELGLAEAPAAIEHPWKLVAEQPERAPRVLPAGIPMREVFDQFDKTLLILGVPGSGKTTLLLELTRDLIERAKDDPAHPMPVVFNLSSWAVTRPALTEWLADELNQRYDVPRKIAQGWVQNDQVLPLLDGLDEVAEEHRAACVEAINAFRAEHGFVPLVVCSRTADYEALSVRLRLPGAVTIEPLTRDQVEGYLEQGGTALSGVRVAVRGDETLWELLDTPLMLSILRLAFRADSESASAVVGTGPLAERRSRLFNAYIEAMFKRRAATSPYTPQQTRHWLSWLAGAMVSHNQTVFYLERMQPDWLPKVQAWLHRFSFSMVGWLGGGLVGGLIFGLGGGLVGGLGGWLFFGLLGGLGGGLGSFMESEYIKKIKPAEALRWSWKEMVGGFGLWLLGGLLFGLGNQTSWMGRGLVVGLIFGLGLGLVGGLGGGVITVELSTRTIPNEGIRRSLKNAMVGWLVSWLFFGLVVVPVVGFGLWLLGGLGGGLGGWLFFGLVVGPVVGFAFGLAKGGSACILHGVLRLFLSWNHYAPLNYVRFLEHAKDLLFLRRVGGGYIFVHRMLMEHFAGMEGRAIRRSRRG